MKLTVSQIIAAASTMQKLLQQELGIKSGYHVARLAGKLQQELLVAEEARKALVMRHCGPPDDDGAVRVLPENLQKFQEEYVSLASAEIEVVWQPMTLEMLERASLSPSDFIALGPLVADPSSS